MPAASFFLASTGAKIDSNPENTVCVMTMANKGCVRSNRPPTDSQVFNQICQAGGAHHTHKGAWTDLRSHAQYVHQPWLDGLHPNRNCNHTARAQAPAEQHPALARCHLCLFALKDILPDTKHALVHLAKKLKKNNIVLDVTTFGDSIEEAGKGSRSIFHTFVETASSFNNSYVLLPALLLKMLVCELTLSLFNRMRQNAELRMHALILLDIEQFHQWPTVPPR